jgi:hypothetical protein
LGVSLTNLTEHADLRYVRLLEKVGRFSPCHCV